MKSGIYILSTINDKITGFVLFYHSHRPNCNPLTEWHIRRFTRCTMPFVKDMASRLVLDTDEIRILTVAREHALEDTTP